MVKIILYVLLFIGISFSTKAQKRCDDTIDNQVFGDPEQSPIFDKQSPYGLLLFIEENLRYPETAIEDKIEGKVFVDFWIDTVGCTQEHRIIKGIREDLDNEALRVVKLLKFEEPAKNRGKPFGYCFTISISFVLPKKVK